MGQRYVRNGHPAGKPRGDEAYLPALLSFTGLVLWLAMTGVSLYVLFFVIRAGVEAGIRGAVPEAELRPKDTAERRGRPGSGAEAGDPSITTP